LPDSEQASVVAADELVPGLPLDDYKHLTVAHVLPKLRQMTPAQLRRVLDFERRHGNRRPVLDAIEQALTA
jgi:hypothetical protein